MWLICELVWDWSLGCADSTWINHQRVQPSIGTLPNKVARNTRSAKAAWWSGSYSKLCGWTLSLFFASALLLHTTMLCPNSGWGTWPWLQHAKSQTSYQWKDQVFPDFTAKCVSYAICDLFCICSWTMGLAQDVQWDKPGTVIAQMTTELSELFTREMTRVSATLHFAELLWFIRLLFQLLCPGLNKNMQFVVLHWEISFSGWKCCWGYACAVHWWDRRSGHGGITKQWAHSKETHWWASCQDKDQWICESCFLFLLCNWKVVCKGFSFGLG